MIFHIVGLLIGVMLSAAGIYYLIREKQDMESRKIYGITLGVGIILILFMIIRIHVLS